MLEFTTQWPSGIELHEKYPVIHNASNGSTVANMRIPLRQGSFMKRFFALIALLLLVAIELVQHAFIYASITTLIGIAVVYGCVSLLGGWGLLSLFFVLPFIRKGIIRGQENEADRNDERQRLEEQIKERDDLPY